MKRAFIILAVSVVLLTSMMPYVRTVSAASTLAATMKALMDGVAWSNHDLNIQHVGYWMHEVTSPVYSAVYPHDGSQWPLAEARLNEVDQTGSPTQYTSASWPKAAGSTMLPDGIPGFSDWLIYYRWAYHLYDWFPASWNRGTALSELWASVGSPSLVSLTYPSKSVGNPPGSQRYYDEYIETADALAALGSISDAVQVFQQDTATHWNGQYYGYTGMGGFECEAGPFAMIAAKLYHMNGNSMPGFTNVPDDLAYKLLNSEWTSPLWNGHGVVVHYNDARERLQNTVAAWAALQMFWTYFTPTEQAHMANMLRSSAWGHIMASQLYDSSTNKFRLMTSPEGPPSVTPMDTWTAEALEGLFLTGIVPDTGSLAIPLTEEMYEDTLTYFSAQDFGFDYNSMQIKIPVRAGTLHFLFGPECSYTFPSDGIYTVTFGSGWGSVSGVNKVVSLTNFEYLPAVGGSPPPPDEGTLALTATYNGNPVAASVHVVGPTTTTVTTPINLTVGTGAYSLTATYDPGSGTLTIPKTATVSKGATTSVNFPFISVLLGTLTIKCKYDGVLVVVAVTVDGPSNYHKVGSTTLNDQAPLTYSGLQPGTYTVIGNYANKTLNPSYIVVANSQKDAVLDFGGTPTPPFEIPTWAVPLVGISAGGIIAVGIVGNRRGKGGRAYAPPPRRKRRPRVSHPRVRMHFSGGGLGE